MTKKELIENVAALLPDKEIFIEGILYDVPDHELAKEIVNMALDWTLSQVGEPVVKVIEDLKSE